MKKNLTSLLIISLLIAQISVVSPGIAAITTPGVAPAPASSSPATTPGQGAGGTPQGTPAAAAPSSSATPPPKGQCPPVKNGFKDISALSNPSDLCSKEKLKSSLPSGPGKTEVPDTGEPKPPDSTCGHTEYCKKLDEKFKEAKKCDCPQEKTKAMNSHRPVNPESCGEEKQQCVNQKMDAAKTEAGNEKTRIETTIASSQGKDMTVDQASDCLNKWAKIKEGLFTCDQTQLYSPEQIAKADVATIEKLGHDVGGHGLSTGQQAAIDADQTKAEALARGAARGGQSFDPSKFPKQGKEMINSYRQAFGNIGVSGDSGPANPNHNPLQPPVPGSQQAEALTGSQIELNKAQAAAALGSIETGKMQAMGGILSGIGSVLGALGSLMKAGEGSNTGNGATTSPSGASQSTGETVAGQQTSLDPCLKAVFPTLEELKKCQGKLSLSESGVVAGTPVTGTNKNAEIKTLLPIVDGGKVTQLASAQPGASITSSSGEGFLPPAVTGKSVLGAFGFPRMIDVISENVVIGDYPSYTITRYPIHSLADKPKLIHAITGREILSGDPWPNNPSRGLPPFTIKYFDGSPPPGGRASASIGTLGESNIVKIDTTAQDLRVDLLGKKSFWTVLFQNGIPRGSSLTSAWQNREVTSLMTYLINGLGPYDYVVSGQNVVSRTRGKIIATSVAPEPSIVLSRQQKDLIYGMG